MPKHNFQNCQKIVVFSKDQKSVLLCKRSNETELNEVFTFIGGKMEISDATILDGLKREKNEEVGEQFKIKLFPTFSSNILYKKNDGRSMILPHYYAIHVSGEINLNEEYSEYKWVKLEDLEDFEPKYHTTQHEVEKLIKLKQIMSEEDFVVI